MHKVHPTSLQPPGFSDLVLLSYSLPDDCHSDRLQQSQAADDTGKSPS